MTHLVTESDLVTESGHVTESDESADTIDLLGDHPDNPREGHMQPMHLPHSWVVSLLFWCSLLISAVMYGSVSLSPKLAEWIRTRQQYSQNALRLAELEDDIDYLERVSAALQSDPEFSRRLAQAAGPAQLPGHEFVPVTDDLALGAQPAADRTEAHEADPAFSDAVFYLASHQKHRQWLLISSGLLTLFGFTFLNDSGSGCLLGAGRGLLWLGGLPIRRYWRNRASAAAAEQTPAAQETAEQPRMPPEPK